MRRNRSAMTLVEIAIALAVLTVGLTAITATYITALRWAREARDQFTGMAVARQALLQPSCLAGDRAGTAPLHIGRATGGAGWSNGYYVLRMVEEPVPLANEAGSLLPVRVEVYAGGTDTDGELIAVLEGELLTRSEGP